MVQWIMGPWKRSLVSKESFSYIFHLHGDEKKSKCLPKIDDSPAFPFGGICYTPEIPNVTNWEMPIFKRKYIDSFMVDFPLTC